MVTMSQKSSLLQVASSVSLALTPDTVPPTSLVERPTRIHQDSQIVNENQPRNSGYYRLSHGQLLLRLVLLGASQSLKTVVYLPLAEGRITPAIPVTVLAPADPKPDDSITDKETPNSTD